MAVSKRTRFEVLRRDDYTCRYCRTRDNPITIDHVIPVALGGTDDPSNLVVACKDCNAGKSSVPLDAATVPDVSDETFRWAAALRSCLIGEAVALDDRKTARQEFLTFWNGWRLDDGTTLPIPSDWADTVDQWTEIGVPLDLIEESVRIAMTRRTVRPGEEFRYMCGCVWKMINQQQDTAARMVQGGGA